MSLFGLSVIIRFLKTQLYQRLASSKQEAFILDEKRKGGSFFYSLQAQVFSHFIYYFFHQQQFFVQALGMNRSLEI